jgi:hypothetical protein
MRQKPISGTDALARPLSWVIARRWTVALRAIRTALPAIAMVACLCACSPADRLVAKNHPAPEAILAEAALFEATHYSGGSTEPRTRHRVATRHTRHHHETQQAQADTVNPPFGAGE